MSMGRVDIHARHFFKGLTYNMVVPIHIHRHVIYE